MAKEGLIDRWIEQWSSDSKLQEEAAKILVEKLNENFRDEMILAKELEAEAGHLLYEHLANDVRKLSWEKRKHAETVEKLIAGLGGKVDRDEADSYNAEPSGQFREILKLETALGERLVEQLNLAEDAGLDEPARVLTGLKGEHSRHQEEIERIIMKINSTL